MGYMRVGNTIHPLYGLLHCKIAQEASAYSPTSIVDIGGKGQLQAFTLCPVQDANLTQGYDGSNLHQFKDHQFDVVTSIAVLEHVPLPRRTAFFAESLRVARCAAIHWAPVGEPAERTEQFKRSLGVRNYNHRCIVLEPQEKMEPFLTIGEYLLSLATLYPGMNGPKLYNFIYEHGREYYGAIFHLRVADFSPKREKI